MPAILAPERQRQEDYCNSEASQGYTVRPYFQEKQKNKKSHRDSSVGKSTCLATLTDKLNVVPGSLIEVGKN